MALRVLIVDDDENVLFLLETTLGMTGVDDIWKAKNGLDGLSMARRAKPDVILLDIEMPGMDGFEVLEELKKDEETRDIPVIFLTGHTEPDYVQRALDLGAAAYMTKPFTGTVLAEVEAALAKAGVRSA